MSQLTVLQALGERVRPGVSRERSRAPRRARMVAQAALAACCVTAAGAAAPAAAQGGWWQINSEVLPANVAPGGEALITIVASNLGDGTISGANTPITITSRPLPGLTVTGLSGEVKNGNSVQCVLASETCTFAGNIYPYEQLTVTVRARVSTAATGTLFDEATVASEGLAPVSRRLPVNVNAQPAGFGIQTYELAAFNEDGTPDTQAGSQPFELTTTLVLNQNTERMPVALPKDLRFHLPPGLLGNPTAATQCTEADFNALVDETNLCPPSSVVGVATVTVNEPFVVHLTTRTVPVFNLVPAHGEPARFGFVVIGKVPIVINTSVRSGGDYGVDVSVENATETAGVLSSQVTLWGDPGAPAHNSSRGWECVAGDQFQGEIGGRPCPANPELAQRPFLMLPTACAADPNTDRTTSTMEADSWTEPGTFAGAEYSWSSSEGQGLGFTGCESLPFAAEVLAESEVHSASTPSAVDIDVNVPQQTTLQAGALAEADVRNTTVTLPAGVELSPSAANGLQACSESPQNGYQGIGFTGFQKFYGSEPSPETATFTPAFRFREEYLEGGAKLPPSCPEASKLGTVEVETPLLEHPLRGDLYLASPAPNGEPGRNPFNSLVALYIVAEDPVSGVLVKLAGEGVLNEETLQVATTFRNAPRVPFSSLKVHLLGGERASLSTPALCGGYQTSGQFTPWSGIAPVNFDAPAEHFAINSGAGGSACPATVPFAPETDAHTTSTQAGAFTDFALEVVRPDGNQALSGLTVTLPPGQAAMLSAVQLCTQAQAATDTCPTASEIGQAIAMAGLGTEPYVQEGGRVFITEGYGGAPFGLEILTSANAGPFELGYVTVRSKIYIDRTTAAVTIVTPQVPTQIRGIPLQLKRVLVGIQRHGFDFNPTSCNRMNIHTAIQGAEGAAASGSVPFQVGGCGSLPFSPKLTASAHGHGSKAEGTTFKVTVASGGVNAGGVAQAGIAKVELQLPKQLSSRLPTLQIACSEAAFNANPASCDEGSVIGDATIHTPVLKNPLSGPAYLVSHGNAAFPDVEFVLQGEGITLVLDGKTQIKNGITYSKFESAPDAPFTVFETVLPAGPHGVLTANVAERKHFDLCGENLQMPTTIIAHNGATIQHDTRIAIEGCAAVKAVRAKKLTKAQKLANALEACRREYKHNARRRQQCEMHPRHKYAGNAAARERKTRAAGKRKR